MRVPIGSIPRRRGATPSNLGKPYHSAEPHVRRKTPKVNAAYDPGDETVPAGRLSADR